MAEHSFALACMICIVKLLSPPFKFVANFFTHQALSGKEMFCWLQTHFVMFKTLNASINSSGAHPPPPGVSRAFAHVSIPGVGHLKFYHCPGVGHLPTPRTTPGHLTR